VSNENCLGKVYIYVKKRRMSLVYIGSKILHRLVCKTHTSDDTRNPVVIKKKLQLKGGWKCRIGWLRKLWSNLSFRIEREQWQWTTKVYLRLEIWELMGRKKYLRKRT